MKPGAEAPRTQLASLHGGIALKRLFWSLFNWADDIVNALKNQQKLIFDQRL